MCGAAKHVIAKANIAMTKSRAEFEKEKHGGLERSEYAVGSRRLYEMLN
jgi:hypothetical protein